MQNDNTQALSMETLLEKIDQIASDTDYLRDAVKAIGDATENDVEEKASALVSVVNLRETTNQQLIALYSRMLEGMQKPPADDKMNQLRQLTEMFQGAAVPSLPFLRELAEKMLGLPTAADSP